ncbi:MAG: ThuA domain-containing protein, partial [Planctomycetaceae bacterium]
MLMRSAYFSGGLRPPLALLTCGFAALAASTQAAEPFALDVRKRVEASEGSGRFHAITKPETWDTSKTAILVCDVWDLHTSRNATLRTGELAPVIDELVKEVRQRGGTVIHCPSDTMAHYEGHPARIASQKTPKAEKLPKDISTWCYSIPAEEQGVYPIDQSDGGQDDDPALQEQWAKELVAKGRKARGPWIKQHDAIAIEAGDYVTDKGVEVWSILEARGIDNVLMTGVHTNMCVLGRPFGLRRLASNGKNVVLIRDLTDTMYNPAAPPYVSHFTGTDLIVEHIEKYVCGTITSDQILGGWPFRFEGDTRATAVIVVSEAEYGTEKTLPAFAARHLGHHFRTRFVFGDDEDGDVLPGIEDALADADVLLLSVRRRSPPFEQMKAIRMYCEGGGSVVGIRTANHAFSLKGKTPPEGKQAWEELDKYVFGGNYHGHHGNDKPVTVTIHPDAVPEDEANLEVFTPILTDVDAAGLKYNGSLYQVSPLRDSATPLLTGTVEGAPPEPIAWTNRTAYGGQAFYTSFGAVKDFENEAFRRMLFNALCWASGRGWEDGRQVPASMPDTAVEMAKAGGGGAGETGERGTSASEPRPSGSADGRTHAERRSQTVAALNDAVAPSPDLPLSPSPVSPAPSDT